MRRIWLADRRDVPLGDLERVAAFLDRGVLGGQAERVEAHRPQHRVAVAAAEVRDDVAQRVVEDVPHVQAAGRVRAASRACRSARRRSSPGAGFVDVEGTARPPRPPATSARLSCASYASIVLSPRNEKASRTRGRGKLPRRVAALLPGSGKKQVHCASVTMPPRCSQPRSPLLPDTAAVDGRRARARRHPRRPSSRASSARRSSSTTRQTLRAQARAYRAAAPGALVVYGTKAFPSIAVLRLFAEEGLGADVSTVGELAFALRAGHPRRAARDPRQQQGGRAAAARDRGRRADRARLARRARARARARRDAVPVRVTPGIEADTHEAIKTAHHGSKFGLPPDDAVEALRRAARDARACTCTSARSCMHFGASLMTVDWIAQFAARARAELDWTPRIVDLGGGLGVRHVLEEPSFTIGEFVGGLVGELERAWHLQGLPAAAADPRARPLARLARRRDALLGRRRQARERGDDVRDGRRRHVRQPAPGDVRRALHRAARQPRRRASRPAPTPSRASTASRATC